jgi:hypothetical protein
VVKGTATFEVEAPVRGELDAGADLAECRRLLEDVGVDALRPQGVGRRESADSAADDGNREVRHSSSLAREYVR